jgi:hypothetical protein
LADVYRRSLKVKKVELMKEVELMGREVTREIKDESGKPIVAKSKMGEATVSALEVKGIENLTKTEKKHLLLQLARDIVSNPSAGPWEVIDVRREEWRTVKSTLTQPIEIDVKDKGRNALFEVLLDITQLERDLEAEEVEAEELGKEKRKTAPKD